MRRPILTLTTDFGYADGYVGAVKGVILGICPDVALVDISHEIPVQAVLQAAHVLATAAPYYPAGSIHLAVVDPGVGSGRRSVAVQAERALYVAPDNGLLSLALRLDPPRVAVHLTRAAYHLSPVSATFHGRDIFAPVAAHLAAGADIREVGEPFAASDLVPLPVSQPVQQPDGSWLGQVTHIDRYGNLLTNLPHPRSEIQNQDLVLRVGGASIAGLSRTYTDVEPGEPVAYFGSGGHLEIGVRESNAARALRVQVGAPVLVSASGRP